MKEFLSREGAAFTVHNVDEDDRAYDELLARGFRTVPLTLFGGHAIAGFNPVELKAALAAYRATA